MATEIGFRGPCIKCGKPWEGELTFNICPSCRDDKDLSKGSSPPTDDFGNEGQTYLDWSTGNIYQKSSGTWVLIFSPSASPRG